MDPLLSQYIVGGAVFAIDVAYCERQVRNLLEGVPSIVLDETKDRPGRAACATLQRIDFDDALDQYHLLGQPCGSAIGVALPGIPIYVER